MATLRRSHAPVPRGAQVEQMVWERSRPGKPKRRRSVRPSLAHDPGWDCDGSRILFKGATFVSDAEEDCGVQAQLWEDANLSTLSGTTPVTLSLFDVARCQVTKGRGKAKSDLKDFEVIRVPKVVPISEEEPDLWDSWELGEWEKLDALVFKRTYSQVARGFVEGSESANAPGCSRHAASRTKDDSWEYL